MIFPVFLLFSLFTNQIQLVETQPLNIYDEPLQSCCTAPMTGYYRNGFCQTGSDDRGTHVVCAEMTEDFLSYTKSKGNDLSTPIPAYDFPGLKPGDRWCLCIIRWLEAEKAGIAPKINLKSTNKKALEYTNLKMLEKYAVKI
jgi:uncharacterized protein (DUF2237 family)